MSLNQILALMFVLFYFLLLLGAQSKSTRAPRTDITSLSGISFPDYLAQRMDWKIISIPEADQVCLFLYIYIYIYLNLSLLPLLSLSLSLSISLSLLFSLPVFWFFFLYGISFPDYLIQRMDWKIIVSRKQIESC